MDSEKSSQISSIFTVIFIAGLSHIHRFRTFFLSRISSYVMTLLITTFGHFFVASSFMQ